MILRSRGAYALKIDRDLNLIFTITRTQKTTDKRPTPKTPFRALKRAYGTLNIPHIHH